MWVTSGSALEGGVLWAFICVLIPLASAGQGDGLVVTSGVDLGCAGGLDALGILTGWSGPGMVRADGEANGPLAAPLLAGQGPGWEANEQLADSLLTGRGTDPVAGWQQVGPKLATGRASLEAGWQLEGPRLAAGKQTGFGS